MKEAEITQLEQKIAELEAKIANLETQLNNAMQSGDEATQALRRQLQEVNEAFDAHKTKAKQEYEKLQSDLTEKHRTELQ